MEGQQSSLTFKSLQTGHHFISSLIFHSHLLASILSLMHKLSFERVGLSFETALSIILLESSGIVFLVTYVNFLSTIIFLFLNLTRVLVHLIVIG